MSLKDLVAAPKERALIVTLCGEPGVGKTTLAATFPKPLFIPIIDDGLAGMSKRPDALPLVQSADQFFNYLTEIVKSKGDGYKTIVIDTVTDLERLFIKDVIDKDDNNPVSINQACGGFGNGVRAVGGMHQRVRRAAGQLAETGVNVVFIAHAKTEMHNPPDLPSYIRFTLAMNQDHSVPAYNGSVDVVGFMRIFAAVKDKKAISNGGIMMDVLPLAANISKNRIGMRQNVKITEGQNPFVEYWPLLKRQLMETKTK
jgi:hypothetical protein